MGCDKNLTSHCSEGRHEPRNIAPLEAVRGHQLLDGKKSVISVLKLQTTEFGQQGRRARTQILPKKLERNAALLTP